MCQQKAPSLVPLSQAILSDFDHYKFRPAILNIQRSLRFHRPASARLAAPPRGDPPLPPRGAPLPPIAVACKVGSAEGGAPVPASAGSFLQAGGIHYCLCRAPTISDSGATCKQAIF